MFKIGFYLENRNLVDVDLSQPEKGNPGVGGTEFNFITLACHLIASNPDYAIHLYANRPEKLPDQLKVIRVNDCVEAIEHAVASGFEFFVWRPTVRDDARYVIENIAKYNIKIIIWAHNTPKKEYLDLLAQASNVRRLVPVGFEQARLIGDHPIKKKIRVINNGFDSSAYHGLSFQKDNNSVVYTGSMIPVKGFGLLARAWKSVVAKFPNAKLTVIGSGQLYNRNVMLGRWGVADESFEENDIIPFLSGEDGKKLDSVTFLGVLGSEKLPILSKALIGVVNPSGRGENCPGSAIEFLACKTAVVSASSEGLLDVVEHGVTGLLGQGVEALVHNLCELLGNPVKAIEFGNNGPNIIEERFNYDFICRQWSSLFWEEMVPDFGKDEKQSDRYFPYFDIEDLKEDIAFRKQLSLLTLNDALSAYSASTLFNSRRLFVQFIAHVTFWEAKTRKSSVYFPAQIPSVKWLHASLDYPNWLKHKYTLPGWLDLVPGDVVFDCGAFVGGFAKAALMEGCKVHVFEPDVDNFECAKRNTAVYSGVTLNRIGLYDQTTTLLFNVSNNPVESSILPPDTGGVKAVLKIQVSRIDDYCAQHKITEIDFLKVEAEGVEVEVINGIGNVVVNKVAVDCSPERQGESPFDEIESTLMGRGYQTMRRGWILFARLIS
jgi:FkbM family methyltransferase